MNNYKSEKETKVTTNNILEALEVARNLRSTQELDCGKVGSVVIRAPHLEMFY
jgi:hypothetical protein